MSKRKHAISITTQLYAKITFRIASEFLVERLFLLAGMKCSACGLVLTTHTEVHHAGLEPDFSKYASVELHELFQQEYEEDYNNM